MMIATKIGGKKKTTGLPADAFVRDGFSGNAFSHKH
jgi:hypothetical protein